MMAVVQVMLVVMMMRMITIHVPITFAHGLVINRVAILCSEALVQAASLVEQSAVVHGVRLHLLDTSREEEGRGEGGGQGYRWRGQAKGDPLADVPARGVSIATVHLSHHHQSHPFRRRNAPVLVPCYLALLHALALQLLQPPLAFPLLAAVVPVQATQLTTENWL